MRLLQLMTLAAVLVAAAPRTVFGQELCRFEGYWSALPAKPGSIALAGRGLVTAIYPPLTSSFEAHEYTWVLGGLLPTSRTVVDSIQSTTFDLAASTFAIYEDAGQNARPGFYDCPSDLAGSDVRYGDGTLYLLGQFETCETTLDLRDLTRGEGTWTYSIRWIGGSHLAEVPLGRRLSTSPGSTTTQSFVCIPPGYSDALTGRLFLGAATPPRTWGQLKARYYK